MEGVIGSGTIGRILGRQSGEAEERAQRDWIPPLSDNAFHADRISIGHHSALPIVAV